MSKDSSSPSPVKSNSMISLYFLTCSFEEQMLSGSSKHNMERRLLGISSSIIFNAQIQIQEAGRSPDDYNSLHIGPTLFETV